MLPWLKLDKWKCCLPFFYMNFHRFQRKKGLSTIIIHDTEELMYSIHIFMNIFQMFDAIFFIFKLFLAIKTLEIHVYEQMNVIFWLERDIWKITLDTYKLRAPLY